MRTPYQLWRHWVEKQKGPVTKALLDEPEVIEGFKPLALLLRFTKHNDFGHYLTGEIRGYCRTATPNDYSRIPGSCRYLLRRAYVPMDAESYDEPNPVSEWTRKNFNAPHLARHFRKVGLKPDTDWWMADRDKIFSVAPSPQAILTESAVVVRLDTLECPKMRRAIEALEGKPIGVKVDFGTVGKDDEELPPRPHAVISTYTLYLRGGGSRFVLEGSGGPIAEMVDPILDAADACEKARPG